MTEQPLRLDETEFIDLNDSDLDDSSLVEALIEDIDPRSILTKEIFDGIIAYVKAGAYVTHAANACGVEPQLFAFWIARGLKEPDSIYGLFREQMMKAYGMAAIRNEVTIQQAAPNDWKAAAWILSKRYPEIYGKDKVSLEVSGVDGKPVNIGGNEKAAIMISSEELKKMLAHENVVNQLNTIEDVEEKDIEDEISSYESKKTIDISINKA